MAGAKSLRCGRPTRPKRELPDTCHMGSTGKNVHQHSAGGVVIRSGPSGDKYLAIRPAGTQRWQLPKGLVDSGEEVAAAAFREVREEGGVDAEIIAPLKPVHYFYRSRGALIAKTVDLFLMHYVGGDVSRHDHEVSDARWFPLDQPDRLSYHSEAAAVAEARRRLTGPDSGL